MKKIVRTLTALCAFIVLAIVVAACGSSNSVSSSDVANVAGNPISKQAFNHWMYVAEKGNSQEDGGPVIVPTDPPQFNGCIKQVREQISEYANTAAATLRKDCNELFTELSSQVMDFLVTAYWYQGSAYKDGITLSDAQLTKDFNQAKKQEFPTTTQENQFLEQTGETLADIKWRLRVNAIYAKLIAKQVPKITTALEMKYYKAHPTEFGTPEERNIRLIQTTSQSQIEKAAAALKSGQSFAAVSKQYSTNTETKANGGVITDVQSGQEEAAVNKVIFSAPLNKLEGPVKGNFGYYLVEVTKITPAVTDPFSKEQPEIKQLLTSQYDDAAETKVNKAAKNLWMSKTACAAAYSMADCNGYKPPKTTTATTSAGSSAGSSAAGTSVTATTATTSTAGSAATATTSSTTTTN